MYRGLIQFRSFLLVAATFLSACAVAANSPEDIKPGEALVIAQYFEREIRSEGSSDNPGPQIKYGGMSAVFARYDPLNWPRTIFSVIGAKNHIFATAVKPGKYRMDGVELLRVKTNLYVDAKNGIPVIDIRPGEAVYIGDVVASRVYVESKPFSFKGRRGYGIEFLDNEAAAKTFFDEKFAGSGLKFTKRLMRRVPESSL
ncbi:MAG: hypothetical protein GKS02_10135 [Alphaproteobacteria bacterium]|nr:hypothetical protein [Alphaproteobacteria bacterium]